MSVCTTPDVWRRLSEEAVWVLASTKERDVMLLVPEDAEHLADFMEHVNVDRRAGEPETGELVVSDAVWESHARSFLWADRPPML